MAQTLKIGYGKRSPFPFKLALDDVLVIPSSRADFRAVLNLLRELTVALLVPEHFCSPLLQLAAAESADLGIKLVSQPSGTGQMMSSLQDGTIDVAIALTESLIAGIAKGAQHFKLVGSYVSTPLNWAVVCGKDAPHSDIKDLEGTPIGISRIGSGSQVMASVLALQNWSSTENLNFKVLDSFQNLRNGVNSGEAGFFMWEWFTTKPFADSGEVKFVGNVYTPWPSWSIAARPQASSDNINSFLKRLSSYTTSFDSQESRAQPNVDFIKKEFGYEEVDIRAWQEGVGFYHDTHEVHQSVVQETLKTLEVAGVLKAPQGGWQMDTFVRQDVSKLV